jgi:UDP-glucose 4-epimerase
MNILVTGGLGYVGTTLIPILFKENKINKIIIYDNLSNNNYSLILSNLKLASKVLFIEGNILDNQSLKAIFQKHQIDSVVHLAAKTITPMNDGGFHEFDQINHWGTSILVDAINTVDTVKNVIFLSSFSVYGIYRKKFNENDEPIPVSNYGKSKFLAEKEILNRLPDSINKFILRSGALFGCTSGYRPTTVLNKFIFEAHFFNKIQVFGNGNQKRSFIHVNRLCEIISNILINSDIEKGIYNVFDYTLSINELSQILKELYTNIDLIYMNRDHEMKSIEIESVKDINKILKLEKPYKINHYINEDKSKFSF